MALLTLLVARVYCASVLPQTEYREASDKHTFLRFGQSFALGDFDGDERIDKATLNAIDRSKNIEIRLSLTKSRTVLHFDTPTSEQGSLFTDDVDRDGDSDLIWSDLIHPDDVVIWMDDGGRFDRIYSGEYAQDFVLTSAPTFGDSRNHHRDFAFCPKHNQSPALLPTHETRRSVQTLILSLEGQRGPIYACVPESLFDRGPPSQI